MNQIKWRSKIVMVAISTATFVFIGLSPLWYVEFMASPSIELGGLIFMLLSWILLDTIFFHLIEYI